MCTAGKGGVKPEGTHSTRQLSARYNSNGPAASLHACKLTCCTASSVWEGTGRCCCGAARPGGAATALAAVSRGCAAQDTDRDVLPLSQAVMCGVACRETVSVQAGWPRAFVQGTAGWV